MIPAVAFVIWVATGLGVWLHAFPLERTGTIAAVRTSLTGPFNIDALFETWGEAIPTWMLLAGVLSLAARAGAEGRLWLRLRTAGGAIPRIALGLGLGGTAILGAGLAGLLFAPPAWVVFAILGTAGGAGLGTWAFGRKRRRAVAPPDPGPPLERAVGLAVVIAALVAAAGVFGPETGWDAMMYHLRLPMLWEGRHAIRDHSRDFYATYPQLVECLFTGCRLAGGDALSRWLETACGAMLALSVGGYAARAGGSARLATAAVAASPVLLALVPRAYNDLQLALFGSLALALAADGAWLASGVLAGFAMGTTYVGVLAVPAVAAVAWTRGASRNAVLRWAVAAAIAALPWSLRNVFWRGNPVEPFLAGVFGTAAVLPESVVPFFQRAGGIGALLHDLPGRAGALLLDSGHLQSPLAPALCLWLPLLWWPASRPNRFAAGLRAGALAWLAGWWLLAPDARFALAAAPPLAVLAAAGFARWRAIAADAADRYLLRFALAAPLLAGAGYAASHELRTLDPLSLPLGRMTPARRLARGLVPPPFADLANRAIQARVPADGRVLFVSHFITYHAGRECLADWHAGRSHLVGLIAGARDAEDISRRFRRAGIGWLLFTGPGCGSYLGLPGYYDASDASWAAFRAFLATRSRPAWQTDGYALLELGTRSMSAGGIPYLPARETAAFAAADGDLADGNPAKALQVYLAAPDVLDGVGTTYFRRAEAQIALHQLNEADRDLDRALATGLDTPRLRERRAFVKLALGRIHDAAAEIERAVALLPESAEIEATRRAVAAALTRPARR